MNDLRKSLIMDVSMLPLGVVMFFPFYFLIVNTFKNNVDAANHPLALPRHWNFDNYRYIFENLPITQSFFNTLGITVVAVLFIVLIGAMAAYPIVFNPNKLNKVIMVYLMTGFLIPFQTTLIPLFQLMTDLHLVNKLWGLVLLYLSGCIFAFFLTMGYMKTVPRELSEAAVIDGCSVWGIFWRIILPLLQPITVTVAIYHTMWIWNDFLAPMLFLNDSNKATLVLEVYRAKSQFGVNWNYFMSLTVIVLTPILIFFLFMQRYIVKGLVGGALK